jgi:hypothetical protein
MPTGLAIRACRPRGSLILLGMAVQEEPLAVCEQPRGIRPDIGPLRDREEEERDRPLRVALEVHRDSPREARRGAMSVLASAWRFKNDEKKKSSLRFQSLRFQSSLITGL